MDAVAWVPLNPPAPDSLVRRTACDAPAALKFWHLASLDAPTVAVTWAGALAWAAGVRLPGWSICVLGLLVWAIYVADRLLDARAGLVHPSRHLLQERHYFHWRHRRILLALGICLGSAAAWLIATRLPSTALRRNSIIGSATLFYLWNVHGRKSPGATLSGISKTLSRVVSRNCVVAAIFVAGCLLPALARSSNFAALAAPAIAFAAVAWLNLAAIASWERNIPRAGYSPLMRRALVLGCAAFAVSIALAYLYPRSALLVAAAGASAFLLAALDALASFMEPVLLRAASDLVLLTPVLVLAAGAAR